MALSETDKTTNYEWRKLDPTSNFAIVADSSAIMDAIDASLNAEEAARIAGDTTSIDSSSKYTDSKVAALQESEKAITDALDNRVKALEESEPVEEVAYPTEIATAEVVIRPYSTSTSSTYTGLSSGCRFLQGGTEYFACYYQGGGTGSTDDGELIVWRADGSKAATLAMTGYHGNSTAYRDGIIYVAALDNGTVNRVSFNGSTLTLLSALDFTSTVSGVSSFDITPDGEYYAITAGLNVYTVPFGTTQTGTIAATFPTKGGCTGVNQSTKCVAFADGTYGYAHLYSSPNSVSIIRTDGTLVGDIAIRDCYSFVNVNEVEDFTIDDDEMWFFGSSRNDCQLINASTMAKSIYPVNPVLPNAVFHTNFTIGLGFSTNSVSAGKFCYVKLDYSNANPVPTVSQARAGFESSPIVIKYAEDISAIWKMCGNRTLYVTLASAYPSVIPCSDMDIYIDCTSSKYQIGGIYKNGGRLEIYNFGNQWTGWTSTSGAWANGICLMLRDVTWIAKQSNPSTSFSVGYLIDWLGYMNEKHQSCYTFSEYSYNLTGTWPASS